jgi:hypothetical protein
MKENQNKVSQAIQWGNTLIEILERAKQWKQRK